MLAVGLAIVSRLPLISHLPAWPCNCWNKGIGHQTRSEFFICWEILHRFYETSNILSLLQGAGGTGRTYFLISGSAAVLSWLWIKTAHLYPLLFVFTVSWPIYIPREAHLYRVMLVFGTLITFNSELNISYQNLPHSQRKRVQRIISTPFVI